MPQPPKTVPWENGDTATVIESDYNYGTYHFMPLGAAYVKFQLSSLPGVDLYQAKSAFLERVKQYVAN